jgi:aldose 1-epimerase
MGTSLSAGALLLEVAPQYGGSVAAFQVKAAGKTFDLFRPLTSCFPRRPDALHAGSFPMLPFANCIRDNRFVFNGQVYAVAPNMAGSRLNFHGSGWQSRWRVAESPADVVSLVLDDGKVGDVYRYCATQDFTLTPHCLSIDMTLTNRGDVTLPFSFGQHPWFPRHDGMLLRFEADDLWRVDAEGQTLTLDPIPAAADYSAWRTPPNGYRNDCYTGWRGSAEIAWPASHIAVVITADPIFQHLMFHIPADGQPVVCLEPQSNAPCAFDGLENGDIAPGVIVLAAGETVRGGMRFAVNLIGGAAGVA